MTVLNVYLRLYAECTRKAFAAIGKNPWTLLLPGLVLFARDWAARLAYTLGMLGGIVVSLATAALFSCYLHFVGELVQGGRISATDLRRSFGAYLWPVVNVFFVTWIASLLLGLVLRGNPNGAALLYALWIVALVGLNTVPEVIYLRASHGGVQTIATNWEFLKAQWIPWFAANVPLLGAVTLVAVYVQVPLGETILLGAAVHVAMVFRGNLFRALDRTSHRQRMFAQRSARDA
ncbi:MAG: hypothetical protein A2V77_05435 [Anaeromyxobacter sp. RBG_16_69_14]|nr:MAG: hypothetical protein A2V77_05435 [Anaeromyxobacter sp. RBG_16_69_14]